MCDIYPQLLGCPTFIIINGLQTQFQPLGDSAVLIGVLIGAHKLDLSCSIVTKKVSPKNKLLSVSYGRKLVV